MPKIGVRPSVEEIHMATGVADAAQASTVRTDTEAISRRDFRRSGAVSGPADNWPICERLIQDAENLLEYAASSGIEVEKEIRQKVIDARRALSDGRTVQDPSDLLVALTALSKALKPVSADSLRICTREQDAKKTLKHYRWFALALVCLIIPYSIYAFLVSAICDAITKDIDAANALAVTLAADSQRPSNPSAARETRPTEQQIRNLQQFTATYRSLHSRALAIAEPGALSLALVGRQRAKDNVKSTDTSRAQKPLELPVDLARKDFASVVEEKIAVYQEVRQFAKDAQARVLMTFGALTTGLLPMLYALMGAVAYLVRLFDSQIKARTFTGGDSRARLITAAIAGTVIGLFTGFGTGHGATLSPLALAFLVGYAVDPFSFLDGLVRMFGHNKEEKSFAAPAART
jgi:hypothetical protein